MEVAPCAPHVELHAASLLKNLNLQREQAQFCDCVLRQRHGSGQLYPAHRCLLAASSPVLASIVFSSGVLVELQDPRVSDSVLAYLLDYIYTGVLPDKQEQSSRLLAAAIYLQMNELQDALTAFWKKTEDKDTSDGGFSHGMKICPYKSNKNAQIEAPRIENDPLPSALTESLTGPKETIAHNFANDEMFEECSQKHQMKSKDLTLNISWNAGIKSEVWKRNTDKDLVKTPDKGISSSVSHPRYGAVPVICHSSRADVPRLADSPSSPYFPVTSKQLPISHSTNGYKQSTGGSVIDKHRNQNGQTQETYNASTNHFVAGQDFNTIVVTDQSVTSFSTNTSHDDQNHSDLMQLNPECYVDCLASVKTVLNQGIKHKTDEGFGDFTSKHQRLDIYEFDVSLKSNAEEEQSHWNGSTQCVKGDSEVDNKFCLEMEVKHEHSYSNRCLTERDTKWGNNDPYCDHRNSDTDLGTHKVRNYTIVKHEYDSDSSSKSLEIRKRILDLCPTVSITGLDSDNPSEQGKLCGTQILARSQENKCEFDLANQKYFCKPYIQKEIDVIHKTPGFKYGSSDHSDQSDDLSDGCEVDVLDISGRKSLNHRSDTDNSQKDFLLDANTKPAERNGQEIKDGTSESCQDKGNNGLSTKEAKLNFTRKSPNNPIESFESLTKDQGNNESRTTQGNDITEVSKLNENDICSNLIVPSLIQVSIQPTLTAFVSSSSSGSMPTEKPGSASSPAHHPFQCSLCDRSFSQRGSLNRHVRSHLGVRPFSCPFCPMTFSRQYRVTEHMRVHQRCALGNDFQKNR